MFQPADYYTNPYKVGIDAIENVSRETFSVDAITVVADDPLAMDAMFLVWKKYQQKAEIGGFYQSNFTMHGFKGSSISAVSHGLNAKKGAAMFAVKGPDTSLLLPHFLDMDVRATRVDLASTFQMNVPFPQFAALVYEARLYKGGTKGVSIKDWKLIKGENGDTLYIGQRDKSRYFRMYDKSYEFNLPLGTIWRFEFEYKLDLARKRWAEMLELEETNEAFKDYISTAVFKDGYLCELRLPQPYNDRDLPETPKPLEPIMDRARYLKWMRETVSPVIKTMTARGELVMVLEALGIMQVSQDVVGPDGLLAFVATLTGDELAKVDDLPEK